MSLPSDSKEQRNRIHAARTQFTSPSNFSTIENQPSGNLRSSDHSIPVATKTPIFQSSNLNPLVNIPSPPTITSSNYYNYQSLATDSESELSNPKNTSRIHPYSSTSFSYPEKNKFSNSNKRNNSIHLSYSPSLDPLISLSSSSSKTSLLPTSTSISSKSQFISNYFSENHTGEVIELKDITPLLELKRDSSDSSINQKIKNRRKMKCFDKFIKYIKRLFKPKELENRIIYAGGGKSKFKPYSPNRIRNQKFNVFTFLPLVLFEQFRYFFNLYFLCVCISQFFPDFSVGYLFTYVSPLLFVLFITMAKEAYDDFKRYRRDKEANSQMYKRLTPHGLKNIPSSKIKVGDIIHLEKNQRVPADLILLQTGEKSGSVFIRTDQLDGETDWKLRIAASCTQKLKNEQDLLTSGIYVAAEKPHQDIHSFMGTISMGDGQNVDPLNAENTLWMNTVLAAGTAYGLVIYTGAHTRAAMNTSKSSTKFGLIDSELNKAAKVLFLISLIMSVVLICLKGFFGPWFIYLVRFFILFSSIIPLSLRVNVDMARLFYSYQIVQDEKMPDVIVRNSSIPEELGRIGILLSDKTGTLTQNDMELKKLHLGTVSLGTDASDISEITSHITEVQVFKQQKESMEAAESSSRYVKRGRRDLSFRIYDVVQALCLCHNVTPTMEDDVISYQASSPDEVAIVKWTQMVGMTLTYRDRDTIHIKRSTGELSQFSIVEMFPFTSESKRMGIIVQDQTTGEIFFYMKGADTIVAPLVQKNDWLEEECDNMAREGLRTLVITRKRLSEEVLNEFLSKYSEAKLSMHDRKGAMRDLVKSFLEFDLELLGITGVEDRLQDDVKMTLETLRNAGLKIWMLTGDKVETATCIAISSRLVARNQNIYQIQKINFRNDALNALSSLESRLDHALVIDGQSLQLMLDHFRKEFLEIASSLPSVICCRCTPTQKADVAKLLKTCTKKRLAAIGDGGNDVSMIQAADVGIGIVGKEGRQASLAADFSMIQFCHLTRLLLWHGRNSYKGTAKLSQFVIHRGFIIAIMQAVFSSIFYFAPIPLYQGLIAVGYCTVYTTLPVFSLVLDRDIKEDMTLLYPELYKELTKGRAFSFRTFFQWILVSVYQGTMIMLMAIWLFESDFIHIVSITFTSLILNELLMVAVHINTWHYLMILAELFSILIYVLSVRILKYDFDASFTSSLPFFWKVTVITVVSFLPLFFIKILRRIIHPPNYAKLS